MAKHVGEPWTAEVGELPTGHYNAWIRLPPKQTHQLAYARRVEDHEYSSIPTWRDLSYARDRHERQHEPPKGWKSKWHPKTADCSTVDELEMKVDTLNKLAINPTRRAKQHAEDVVEAMFVEGGQLQRGKDGAFDEPTPVKPGKTLIGEIKPISRRITSQYLFYRVEVPDLDIPVGLEVQVIALRGDPDVYICNRNVHPTINPHEHTWKSQDAGDDTLSIPPHDPSYFPGHFYISVFALRDTMFELHVRLVPQSVAIRPPMPSEGDGYKEVKAQIALADTRRRFCRNGVGFKDQLDSPRSLHGTAPSPRASPRGSMHARPATAVASPRAESSQKTPQRPATAENAGRGSEASVAAGSASASGSCKSGAPSAAERRASKDTESEVPIALPPETRHMLLRRTVNNAIPRSQPFASPRGGGPPPGPPSPRVKRTGADVPSARLASQFEEDTHKAQRAVSPTPPPALRFGGRPGPRTSQSARSQRRGSRDPSPASLGIDRMSQPKALLTKKPPTRALSPSYGQEERDAWAKLTDAQKLAAYDEGGDVMRTVQKFIAAQSNVAPEVIRRRAQVQVDERVRLNTAEYVGVQNLLTQRLRSTLDAQESGRLNGYRFRAKASQHIDVTRADNWSPSRALSLVTKESLKMMDDYEHEIDKYVEDLAQQKAEARNAQERSARQRMRGAFNTTRMTVRLARNLSLTAAAKGGAATAREHRRSSERRSREELSSPFRVPTDIP